MLLGIRQLPFFYGWIIVGIVFLDSVAVGSHHNIFGVLIEPMTTETGWSKSQLMAVLTIGALASGVAGPIVGPIIDRYGPRVPMVVASILGGFLLLAVAWVGSLWQLYVLYGLLFGLLRPSTSELVGSTVIPQWFIKKRAVAFATTSMASPFGAAIMVPFAQLIETHYSWRAVWIVMAVLMWAFVSIPGFLFMRRRPEDMGLQPDGSAPAQEVTGAHQVAPVKGEVNWTASQAIRTRSFWLIIAATTLAGSVAGATVMLYLVPYLVTRGFSPQVAAGASSMAALGLVASRFLWGFLLHKLEIRRAFVLFGLLSSLILVLLMASPNTTLVVYPVVALMGAMLGGGGILFNVVWPEYYGRRSLGTIRGWTLPVSAVGRGIGPLLVAVTFDLTKSYHMGFALFVLWYLLAAGAIFLARRPVLREANA